MIVSSRDQKILPQGQRVADFAIFEGTFYACSSSLLSVRLLYPLFYSIKLKL